MADRIRIPGEAHVTESRPYWIITVPTSEVLAAAQKKVAYHTSRVAFWTAEKSRVEKDIRENGIKLDDWAQSMGKASNYTSHAGPNIKVDDKMKEDFFQADTKISTHTELVETFKDWATFLRHIDQADLLELNFSDVVFFNIGRELEA